MNIDNSDVSLFFAGRQDMLTKYALVAINRTLYYGTGIYAVGAQLTMRAEY